MLITHQNFSPKNIRYAFFNKDIPGSSHSYNHNHNDYLKNNIIAANLFGSDKLAIVDQKHTNKVIISNDYNNYSIADGQITNKKNIALAVKTADCVPILLADEENSIIGALHSGWRGARNDIIAEGIKKMQGIGAQKINALIGPCIHQHSYEVDNSFYKDFLNETSDNKKYFICGKKDNYFMFDLPSYVKDKLEKAKIHKIFDINRNTYDDEANFFSFRRYTHNPSSDQGSLISVIMLVD
jgi:polyphenol oxidase